MIILFFLQAGYVKTADELYYIEPKLGEEAADNGEHVHIVYKRSVETENLETANCAVKGNYGLKVLFQ